MTQDKRVVTEFRHWNVRIAKNNIAYPLDRDTFSVLSNSVWGSFSIRFEGCISFIKAFRRFEKDTAVYYHILEVRHAYIKNASGIEHFIFNLAIIYKHNFRMSTK